MGNTCDAVTGPHPGQVRLYAAGWRCDAHRPAAQFTQPAAGFVKPPIDGLAATVIDTVKRAAANAPRSLQVAVGPSEIGTPCSRRLGYKLLDWPQTNMDTDPWASVIGTAVHAWMAAAFDEENQRAPGRYLVEHEVTLPGGITGHADLFDRDTGDNIDWKVVGSGQLAKYQKDGPGEQYRAQAHLYGLGMQLAGEPIKRVAIVFLPRTGRIDGLHVWAEDYDPLVAAAALKRLNTIRDALTALDPERNPQRWHLLPTADAYCTYCPWFLPGSTDLGKGCPGHRPHQ